MDINLGRKIQIINECINDDNKFMLYLSFENQETMKDAALALKKYYLWVLKFEFNAQVKQNKEIEFFINLINSIDNNQYKSIIDIKKLVTSYFSLGEIYFANSDLEKAKENWTTVINLIKDKLKEDTLAGWAEKNLIDMVAQSSKFDDNIKKLLLGSFLDKLNFYKNKLLKHENKNVITDILGFEKSISSINFYISQHSTNEFEPRLLTDEIRRLFENYPKYKNMDKTIFEYYQSKEMWPELKNAVFMGYKREKDICYVNYLTDCLKALSTISLEDIDEVIYILNELLSRMELKAWSKLLEAAYCTCGKDTLSKLISCINNSFKYTQLYTGEFKSIDAISHILAKIYQDILLYRNKYDDIEIFEKNIAKYLFFASSQNKDNVNYYESYTKLLAIRDSKNDAELKKVLDDIDESNVNELGEIPLIKDYPFVKIINELEFIEEKHGQEQNKNLKNLYFRNQDNNYKIMVVGIFSSGKSTFINSFIGERILEEGALPTTSSITVVSAQKQKIDMSVTYSQEKNVENVSVENQFLSDNKIVFIDTPGFEDINIERSELSLSYLTMTDMFIVLLDASKPLTSGEYDKIKYLNETVPNSQFIFVLNKIDFVDEDEVEDVVEYTKENLCKLLQKDILVIPYSAIDVLNGRNEMLKSLKKNIIDMMPKNLAEHRIKDIEAIIEEEKEIIKQSGTCKISDTEKIIKEISLSISSVEDEYNKFADTWTDYDEKLVSILKNITDELKSEAENNINRIFDEAKSEIYELTDLDSMNNNIAKFTNEKINQWFSTSFKNKAALKVLSYKKTINDVAFEKNQILMSIMNSISESSSKYFDINYLINLGTIGFMKGIDKAILEFNNKLSDIKEGIGWGYSIRVSIENDFMSGFSVGFTKFFDGNSQALIKKRSSVSDKLSQNKSSVLSSINKFIDDYLYDKFNDCLNKEEYNKKIFNDLDEKIENIIKKLNNIKAKKDEELNSVRSSLEDIERRIQILKTEILKYKIQVSKGVLYKDEKLFRIS
ncbi:hypothetical protein HMPREF1982_03096 [Clostridiales bacterium oral taxon 876 str. F0540]|nr:hypothetical protein HMPREF1982_03096 [Clostridiales bacterium oral taxon 876 str. F0540]